jgi:hypothetical protein
MKRKTMGTREAGCNLLGTKIPEFGSGFYGRCVYHLFCFLFPASFDADV